MTEEELNSVAERLEVVLSADYRQAALSEARINGIDPGIYFVQDAKEILILNLEVRSFSWWPNQLLCIGFDGCGNFMGIDSSGSVRFLDHETGEFGKNAETIPAYFDWLAPIFKYAKPPLVRDNYRVTHQEPPEFDFIEYAYIARSTVVRESVLNPIARLEWTDFVKASSDFKNAGISHRAESVQKGEKMQIEVPGQAVVVIDHLKVEFGHVFGRIWVKHPRKQVIYRMRDIATTLQARVLFEV